MLVRFPIRAMLSSRIFTVCQIDAQKMGIKLIKNVHHNHLKIPIVLLLIPLTTVLCVMDEQY